MKKYLFFVCAIAVSSPVFAQIPNSDFETWTNVSGYDVPTSWDQLNAITSSTSTYTCIKGSPGDPGSYYLKLVSKTVGGMGVVPGIACTGILDTSDMTHIKPKSGFPFTLRPQQLTGNWQYMAYGTDEADIFVLLTRWNSVLNKRDTIAFAGKRLSGMEMSWVPFTVDLTYTSGATPDSAIITFSSSGSFPVSNSYLSVDNIAFAGDVANGIADNIPQVIETSICPNPATNTATISYASATGNMANIVITDVSGKVVSEVNADFTTGGDKHTINTSGMGKGIYLVRISDGRNTEVRKLIIE